MTEGLNAEVRCYQGTGNTFFLGKTLSDFRKKPNNRYGKFIFEQLFLKTTKITAERPERNT
jgi:hypothetical protein